MFNVHITNISEAAQFPSLEGCVALRDKIYGYRGNTIYMLKNGEIVHSEIVFNQILSIGVSELFDSLIVFVPEGIFLMNDDFEPLHSCSGLSFGVLSQGGDLALISDHCGVQVIDLDTKKSIELLEQETQIMASAFRADNKYLAIATDSYVATYSNDGKIEGKIEIQGVNSMSWNPKGTWLAVTTGNTVEFFEKNCCKRQSYSFSTQLMSVDWSALFEVISVLDIDGLVHILTMNNRKWVKKNIVSIFNPIGRVFWGNNLSFCVFSMDGLVKNVRLNQYIDCNPQSVFVIDGNILQVSHWGKSLIPPPLFHEKIEFDSQITTIAVSDTSVAVFTLNSLYIYPSRQGISLPCKDVYTSCFDHDGVLHFSSENHMYCFQNDQFNEVLDKDGYISFITPNHIVTNCSSVDDTHLKVSSQVSITVQNGDDLYILMDNGDLTCNGTLISKNVHSFIANGSLLSYVHDISKLYIKFDGSESKRDVEPYTSVLFYAKKLFSIILQMTRGNTETISPHIVVESELKELITSSNFSTALNISKRYQVPFSRFIELGTISIPKLFEEISDSRLRPFLSVLQPLASKRDLDFILQMLSFLFDGNVLYTAESKEIKLPQYDQSSAKIHNFYSVICMSFVLLDSPVTSIVFACKLSDSGISKDAIQFLLTLFDNDRLFDISMKSYDTRCIATVGLVTMKEPSSYVPLMKELNEMPENLMKATIDDIVSDHKSALLHYSLCGSDYNKKCFDIIQNEKLFDLGLSLFAPKSNEWQQIIDLKIKHLSTTKQSKELAQTALLSERTDVILANIRIIIQQKMWKFAISRLGDKHYQTIMKTLETTGNLKDAAYVAHHMIKDKEEAIRLYIKASDWMSAIECGAPPLDIANTAFNTTKKDMITQIKEASSLKERFVNIENAQKAHPEASKRSGKQKEKRGLPPIVSRLQNLLPSKELLEEFEQLLSLLNIVGMQSQANELSQLITELIKAIWPIPRLPDNEELLIPEHLKSIIH